MPSSISVSKEELICDWIINTHKAQVQLHHMKFTGLMGFLQASMKECSLNMESEFTATVSTQYLLCLPNVYSKEY
jgi:hypothetical protein